MKGKTKRLAAALVAALLSTLWVSILWAAPGHAAGPDRPSRDFTFLLMSDTHVGVEKLDAKPPVTRADTLARIRTGLKALEGLVGKPYPDRPEIAGLDLGSVRSPRGLIILGDLTDGHKELSRQKEQWKSFEDLFPRNGIRLNGRRVPVFASAGNHDGEPEGPQRRGLVDRNRALHKQERIDAIPENGVHFAMNWDGVHLISLNLCPADATDPENLFRYGKPADGSWNDPQGALSFMKDYLARRVGASGEPVVLMHHYGFDGFSMNDWYWWTAKQRRALYDTLKGYNVAAIFHGHNHHAEHYRWPDPKLHAAEFPAYFDGPPPEDYRQYHVLSCGPAAWVVRVRGDQLIAAHFTGSEWSPDPAGYAVIPLKP